MELIRKDFIKGLRLKSEFALFDVIRSIRFSLIVFAKDS